jgi:hypothetical protein
MAPEQAMAKDVGPWTDLYSVGCMAYELFTGRPPFYDTDEPLAILLRHISEALPPASEVAEVDPDISAWIERLTSKDPKHRPASATAAWEEFEEILIGKLGPRWRRDARLPEPPNRGAEGATGPAPQIEGVDVEGTGPDTGGDVPGQETPAEEPAYETYLPPPSGPPSIEGVDVEGTGPDTGGDMPGTAAEAPAPEIEADQTSLPPPDDLPPGHASPPAAPPRVPVTPPAAEEPEPTRAPRAAVPPSRELHGHAPVARQVMLLARGGGLALVLAAVLIPLLNEWPDRWNVFAVLSPFEAAGVALAAHFIASALTSARLSAATAAGALLGFGGLALIASLALLRFTIERLDAPSTLLAVVALLGAVALLAAGRGCLRSAPRDAAAALDPGPLVLGLAGAGLAGVALFVNYDGFSSLWSEVGEGESAEFAAEPVVVVAAVLAGLALLGARPRAAAGLLLAVGTAASLHYLGVIIAAWRAIGEVGEIRAAGFIGVLGGLLVVAAGAWAQRAERGE